MPPDTSAQQRNDPLKVLVWGACDLGKPRVRIMLSSLKAAGADVTLMRAPVWDGVEDKSGLGVVRMIGFAIRYFFAILRLWLRYFRAPPHDIVLIGYLGQFDALAFWPLKVFSRKPVVLDAFISLYDTVVLDRRKLRAGGLAARFLRLVERLSYRCADLVVFDTATHAARISSELNLDQTRFRHVHVGVEVDAFPLLPPKLLSDAAPLEILFYGQFIPLHGIDTIIAAARQSTDRNWRWRLIGDGQEAPRIRKALAADPISNLEWIDWADYEALSAEIARADVCLGVFGAGEKSGSVVPNKAWQVIASGRPLITRDSAAMQEIVEVDTVALSLISPEDPNAFVAALNDMDIKLRSGAPVSPHNLQRAICSEEMIGQRWLEILTNAMGNGSQRE